MGFGNEGEQKMTKCTDRRWGMMSGASAKWLVDGVDLVAAQATLSEARDNLRLREHVRRAMRRESAPKHLVDRIRNMIRE